MTDTTANSPKKLFVFGLGYSAARAAVAFQRRGFSVAGTSRSRESASALAAQYPTLFSVASTDRNAFVFDGASSWDPSANDNVSLEAAVAGTTHVIVSVPTGRVDGQEDPVLYALGASLIATLKPTLQWLAYLSTIGVYGETHGVAVDESAPVQSTVTRSQMRITAERQWLATGLPVHVFRIAGIYGPGRGTLTKVRSGTATRIDLPGRLFNRIHVDDIVAILAASASHPNPGAIYNVADNEPAPAEQVTAFACELLGMPVPPLQSWDEASETMSAMAKSFYAESKVVKNTRIRDELGVTLQYPTYREGLLAQLLEEDGLLEFDGDDQSKAAAPLVVLANIGSLKPAPYVDLRQISFRLSRALRQPVVPCSFRFSNRIDAALLHNLPATTFEAVVTDFLQREMAKHVSASASASASSSPLEIVVLPLFFGNSATLTEFLPSVLRKACDAVSLADPSLSLSLSVLVSVGRCLVDRESSPDDTRVATILAEKVGAVVSPQENATETMVNVLVLEHGSPNREVHDATVHVTSQLRTLLSGTDASLVQHACMERRDGAAYDFNDPLLEHAIEHYGITTGVVVIALLFFSHGRHAGEKGDIKEIVDGMQEKYPHLEFRVTEPLGTHALLAEILHDRYRDAVQHAPTYVLP